MRYISLFAAASVLALASPAAARDGSGYVGIDAGLLMPKDTIFEYDDDDVFGVEYKNGYDLDIIGGYDFGFIRAEGELSWKRAALDNFFDDEDEADADGETDVRSVMVNLLGDVGSDRFSFYAGGGVGYALVKHTFEDDGDDESLKDGGFAWQGIAGVRYAVNEIIDIGLKYRYFDTGDFEDDDVEWDFTSHSIMFSFIYNMGGERRVAPPPPPPVYVPPPAPPPPATQTCPDGTVILATDACPPPPPPPPPPPEPERG
jgi:opacity protein-like surface antigen